MAASEMEVQEGAIIVLDSQWLHQEELSKEKSSRQLVRIYLYIQQ